MKKPNLFIVGEPKCGTTSLHEYLGQHPDIFMCDPKEPGHFAMDLQKEKYDYTGAYFNKFIRAERYLQLFKDAKDEKVVGEGSTAYLVSKVAAKLIYEFNPSAKIIIMLRNPVDLLYSFHSQLVVNFDEPVKDFKKAILLEKERRKGKNIPKACRRPSLLYYSERAKFTEHINRFMKYFPRNQIKFIIYDDFKKDTKKTYLDVLDFLGVRQDFIPEFEIINPNKETRLALPRKIVMRLQVKDPLKKVLPESIFNSLTRSFHNVVFRHGPRPKMDPVFEKELMKSLKPEVVSISRLLKRDLVREWGYDKIV